MKTLNFTAKEILPSLLDKTKKQTLRPAWKVMDADEQLITGRWDSPLLEEKPARFKVDETIRLLWNQRSKHKWFCAECGEEKDYTKPDCYYWECQHCHKTGIAFSKELGIAKITEVFKIEMGEGKAPDRLCDESKVQHSYETAYFYLIIISQKENDDGIQKITKIPDLDGFKSAEEMFAWFDEKYDLSMPKEFWVYRWEWRLKE